MCAVIFACHNWRGGGVGSAIGWPWVQSRSFPTQSGVVPTSEEPWRGWNTSTRERLGFCVGVLWSCHCLPTPGLVASIALPPPPPPSLSIFYSSPLHTHTPVPLASRPPRHSIAGATSPRVLSPPFHPLPRRGCRPPVRQESAGGCTRLQRPSCPLHSACLPTDWPSCCFHGDLPQSPAPTSQLPPSPLGPIQWREQRHAG